MLMNIFKNFANNKLMALKFLGHISPLFCTLQSLSTSKISTMLNTQKYLGYCDFC